MASSSSSSPELSCAPTTIMADNSSNYSSLEDVLEDLSSRFILNLPESELASVERICFQVEQAHWFYEDFVREGNPQFPSLPLKRFSQIFFHACPVLHEWSSDFEIAFNNFMQYKIRVPVCGAIMLNDTWEKCILVKGWKSSAGWGFPKGKINEDEEPHKCAIREVYEETGYDLTGQIDTENVIEFSIKQQKISLYIVPGVPEDYPFKTRTRKEISKIDWFKLSDLPTWKKSGVLSGKFYLISPFIAPLKNFIQDRKPSSLKRKARRARSVIPFINGATHPDESAESSFESPPHAHSIPDSASHDTSSQSSYADNSLQTPSPEYTQSRLNEPYVSKSSNGVGATGDNIYPKISTNHSDVHSGDHLARLMESLSMSAVQKGTDISKPVPSQLSSKPTSPATSATPVPATASSNSSHRTTESQDPSDWSSYAPRRVSDRHPATAKNSPPSAKASLTKPPYNPVHIDTSLSPSVIHASPAYSSIVKPPSVAQPSMPISLPRHHRSMSALSLTTLRPLEATPSAKRMKQLALLESVVDESARRTPKLEKRSVMQIGQLFTNSIGRASSIPPPSVSVPPLHGSSFAPSNSVLYYSSDRTSVLPPGGVSSVSTLLPPLSSVVGDDPFKVRPRTGDVGMQMQPPYATHGRVRQSMNEKQLAPMLQRQPSQSYGLYQPQSQQSFPPSVSHITPAHYPQEVAVRGAPSHIIPPNHLSVPQSFTPGPPPSSAPAMSPHFDIPPLSHHLPRPSQNSQLLSILNANGSSHPTIGVQSRMIFPPVGVVNGIEHR